MSTRFRVWGHTEIFVDQGGGGGSVVPAPPAYDADLVTRAGVLVWRQHETVTATFANAFQATVTWPTFAARPFKVIASSPVVTIGDSEVTLEITNVSATGCTITLSDAITGTITVDILETV